MIRTAAGQSGTKNSRQSPGQAALQCRGAAKGGCTCTSCWEVEPLAGFRKKVPYEMSAVEKVAALNMTEEINVTVD